MALRLAIVFVLLTASCAAPSVTLHGTAPADPPPPARDLVRMADEHQAAGFRELGDDRVQRASSLARQGDMVGATDMLREAVQYHLHADEAADRARDRRLNGADGQ